MSRAGPRQEPDPAAIGYPAVRQAFNEVLQAFVAKLTAADWEMAVELLGAGQADELDDDPLADGDSERLDELVDAEEEVEPGFDPFQGDEQALLADLFGEEETTGQELQPELLADTALFSRPGEAWSRRGRKRAVDRLARKMPFKREPLKAAIARRLPDAFFSLFEVKGRQPDGTLLVADLLDDGRPVGVMDDDLAKSTKPGMLLAGRLVDLGPWHVGFGIVLPLRRSEAVALLIGVSHPGSLAERRDALHEVVYLCHLHEEDMVMTALEPLISVMSIAIDEMKASPLEIAGPVRAALQEAFVV